MHTQLAYKHLATLKKLATLLTVYQSRYNYFKKAL